MQNHKHVICLLFYIVILISSAPLGAQSSLEEVFTDKSHVTFGDKIQAADRYFSEKHPGKTPFELTQGEYRDGEYVKYRRWRQFWAPRTEKSGELADLGKYGNIYHQESRIEERNNHFEDIKWTNISYQQDLGSQIGLGRTSAMAFHPSDENTFYVGAAIGGIWKTTNGGNSYTPIGDNLPFLAVSSIVLNHEQPTEIYAAISDRVWYGPPSIGVYKSSNDGDTWEPTALTFNFDDNHRIYWMTADPVDGKIVYVASSDGLYVTKDGFETVEKLLNGTFVDVKFHMTDPSVVYATSSNQARLWRSNDGGTSFSAIKSFPGNGFPRIALTKANPDLVSVSSGNLLHTSTDTGTSFQSAKSQEEAGTGDGITMISDLSETRIYSGFFDLYRSGNSGNNWTQISDWLGFGGLPLIHVDYRNAFKNPLQPQFIYLCNDGGVYRINVENDQFENLSNGLIITQYYDIAVSQTNPDVMSGGSQDNGNVFMEDYDWEYAAPTADGMQQAINSVNDFYKYNAIQLGSIYRFQGPVRTNISNNIANNKSGTGEWITPFVLGNIDPNTIYAGYESVYRSTNLGNSWTKVGEELVPGRNLDLLAVSPQYDEKVYAIENYGKSTGDMYGQNFTISRLFERLTDGSNEWLMHVLPVSEAPQDIAVDPKDPLHLFISVAGYTDGHKVFESIDGGASWENISFNLPNAPATAISIYSDNSDHLFVGTDAGMYYLELGSNEWKKMGSFPHTFITDIEIVQDVQLIRVGTHGRGILQGNLSDVSSIENTRSNAISECKILSSNPATDLIQLQSVGKQVSIEIYHINGQLMEIGKDLEIDISSYPANLYQGLMRDESGVEMCVFRFIKVDR